MPKTSGIKILEDREGAGAVAEKGDKLWFEISMALNRGDIVLSRRVRCHKPGRRDVIAGVRMSLQGMREGGYRKVRISPHLGHGDRGVPEHVCSSAMEAIPPNAVLICELWLSLVEKVGQSA